MKDFLTKLTSLKRVGFAVLATRCARRRLPHNEPMNVRHCITLAGVALADRACNGNVDLEELEIVLEKLDHLRQSAGYNDELDIVHVAVSAAIMLQHPDQFPTEDMLKTVLQFAAGEEERDIERLLAIAAVGQSDNWGEPIDPSDHGPLGRLWHRRESEQSDNQPELELFLTPGNASQETIQNVFRALSAVHVAAGGLGLTFSDAGAQFLVAEEVKV